MKKYLVVFFFLAFCTCNTFAQTADLDYTSGNNFEIASFRARVPKTENKIRAVLVIVPGYNGDGRNAVNDSVWQEFAGNNNLAIVACYFKDREGSENFYREASKGSGQALLDAIQKIAKKMKRPEIKNVPLILYGQSAGGQFNYEFACWKPERVLTFVVNKGGFYHTAMAPLTTRKIPAIFFIGENDLYYRNDILKGIYSMNRKLGAIWTLIVEKNTKHEFKASNGLAIKYFESIIPLRMTPSSELRDISGDEYYLGDWDTKTVEQYKGEPKTNSLTVWLPDSEFAKIWKRQYE